MKTEQTTFADEDHEMWFVENNNTDSYSVLMVDNNSFENVKHVLSSASYSNRATPRATSCQHTCAVPDISGLQAQRSAAQCETVSPLPTAPPPGFKELLRIVIPDVHNTDKTSVHITKSNLLIMCFVVKFIHPLESEKCFTAF